MNSSHNDLVYAYSVTLEYPGQNLIEVFVTFDEPNLFVEPYDSLWIKLAATLVYLISILGCLVQYSFVVYEVSGYAASFRTAMNQLVSSCYFLVRTNLFCVE